MSRGNGRMTVFVDDTDYRKFVRVLGDVVERFEIECWNYCVMPNHYHATLRPTQPNLSEALRLLNSVYAQWWNRRHDRVGHVFQGRYKDQIVDRESYLLALSRYVVMNPVRAELVAKPEDWPWSSYRSTVGLDAAPSFLSTRSTLSLFGDAPDEVLQTWFADAMAGPGDNSVVDRIRSNESVLGSKKFKAFVSESTLGGLTPV
jgi:putative transposase